MASIKLTPGEVMGVRGSTSIRLIAAAPELLQALKDILKHGGASEYEWIDKKYHRAAKAAIAKAEGHE